MKNALLLFILFFCTATLFSASVPPKREFRAVWVATVTNLDWPVRSASTQSQKQALMSLFDEMKAAGINAILLQVRTECDAFYNSPYEPWSYWLTGKQGQAPAPWYDPLTFAIEEAHKRGMELHAWFNPYRAVKTIGAYPAAANHVTVTHPEWILTFDKIKLKMLDPGHPLVRQYVNQVVMDVVQRYDIDGVHFDDYFYPYANSSAGFYGITSEDDQTFANYHRGFSNRADWRRDNVNLLVKMVHDSIANIKPWVKFGISPFGIWKSGYPAGISGTSAYDAIYCDALAWLQAKTVDYLTPQLYWKIGGGQDYSKLMPWWASQMNGRHFYPGHAAYRISEWSNQEMPTQLRMDRDNSVCNGAVFFRAMNIRDNLKGFTDSLKKDFYRFKALPPAMVWKNDMPPLAPSFLKYERLTANGTPKLHWAAPPVAADGDSARRYVIYHHQMASPSLDDLADPSFIMEITYEKSYTPPIPTTHGPHYYSVTALDHFDNESPFFATLYIQPPYMPLLAYPHHEQGGLASEVVLKWHPPDDAVVYEIQLATNADFIAPLVAQKSNFADTFFTVKGLKNQTSYYWRVRAANAGGWGEFSQTRTFIPGVPATPLLAFPADEQISVPTTTPVAWHPVIGATQYQLQVAKDGNFSATAIVIDKSALSDTFMVLENLELNQHYFWRVRASNPLGAGQWSSIYRFSTTTVTMVAAEPHLPLNLELGQNYPNPFNNTTIIPFTIPKEGAVRMFIYDMLGRRVMTLANDHYPAGHHEISFDATHLAGGVYVYRLFYQGNILSKRMLYVK